MRAFSFRMASFRRRFIDWIRSRDAVVFGGLPFIYDLIMCCNYETFWGRDGLNYVNFSVVLLFLHVNKFHRIVTRAFWLAVLERPLFDANALVGRDHTYYLMFERIVDLVEKDNPLRMFWVNFCCYDREFSLWKAYNVWCCRGVFSNHINGERVVTDEIIAVDDDAEGLTIVEWPLPDEERWADGL